MNSRGTLMIHRIVGDTLASSDKVAMMPTIQPAAAGTQESREVGRAVVRVISREDKRPAASMVSHEPTRVLSVCHAC